MTIQSAVSTPCLFLVLSAVPASSVAQETEPPIRTVVAPNGEEYPLYPLAAADLPDLPSPFDTEDGREILVVQLADGRTALMDVTCVEDTATKGGRRVIFGPGRQLSVGCQDFPTLAQTGLHAPEELESVTTITGRDLAVIDRIGQPNRISTAGFLADGEDLISVLEADNETVRARGLTHPDLPDATRAQLEHRLTHIHTGEMVAFYIQRYGFYEGHTDFRADPVALAWSFGLRTLQQIEAALPGQLPKLLVERWPD